MSDVVYMVFGEGTNIEIMPTKFHRKIGDKINGKPIIAILKGETEKEGFIKVWNRNIAKLKKLRKQAALQEEAKFWGQIIKDNPALHQAFMDLKAALAADKNS